MLLLVFFEEGRKFFEVHLMSVVGKEAVEALFLL
jgi:hypothetical protein